jgi:hypothetical protein
MADQRLGIKETCKVVLAGIVFGKIVQASIKNGLVDELKDLRFSDIGDAMAFVPKALLTLKSGDALTQVSSSVSDVASLGSKVAGAVDNVLGSLGQLFGSKASSTSAANGTVPGNDNSTVAPAQNGDQPKSMADVSGSSATPFAL